VHIRLFATLSLGLIAAACQAPNQQDARRYAPAPLSPPPYSAGYSSSQQACADYGFTPGAASFDRCVSNEQAARSTGRVNRDYDQARLASDARQACSSYGLAPNSGRYDQCVQREIDARGYRDGTYQQNAAVYRTDQYGNRFDSEGYRIDAGGQRLTPSQSSMAVPPHQASPSRDEYGNRYDSYGNRIGR
jgi:hypothetical protein